MLTQDQINRQDLVDNTIHKMLERLTGKQLPHNIEFLGSIRDEIAYQLRSYGLMKSEDFYPYDWES